MKEFEIRQRAAYHTVAEARRIGTRTRVFLQKSNNRFSSRGYKSEKKNCARTLPKTKSRKSVVGCRVQRQ